MTERHSFCYKRVLIGDQAVFHLAGGTLIILQQEERSIAAPLQNCPNNNSDTQHHGFSDLFLQTTVAHQGFFLMDCISCKKKKHPELKKISSKKNKKNKKNHASVKLLNNVVPLEAGSKS